MNFLKRLDKKSLIIGMVAFAILLSVGATKGFANTIVNTISGIIPKGAK